MVYFVIKYSRKRHPQGRGHRRQHDARNRLDGHAAVLFLVMFYFGWTNFNYMRNVPRDAMVINVTARQWAWSFTYPNGKRPTELYLALDKPVKMDLHSLDVIHGFYMPAFRIKEDVVPGKRELHLVHPDAAGTLRHRMHRDLRGRPREHAVQGRSWCPCRTSRPGISATRTPRLRDGPATAAPDGAGAEHPAVALLRDKSCLTCHSLDGSVMVGPTFKGLYGRRAIVTDANGRERERVADDAYLAGAIQDPGAETVKGYPPVMPPVRLTDEELKQVMAFIEALK